MDKLIMRANPLSRIKIERGVRQVLNDFNPDALSDLVRLDIERMFEKFVPKRFGIETGYEELSLGIHGYTDPGRMRSVVATNLVDTMDKSTRRFGRSTVGHEIGHAVLHAVQFNRKKAEARFTHDDKHTPSYLFRKQDLAVYEDPEWQAWEFCKSLFMPKSATEDAVQRGYTVREISEIIDLNPAFVESRLRNLKMLDKVRAF
ncbi:MAG: ImmA/IrrE family metallo-endopeptidase [Pyrinomonadaceae bacterium]